MNVTMIRARLKPDSVGEAETAVKAMFAAIDRAAPEGIRYASCRLPDGESVVALLGLEDGIENPLGDIPEFKDFQENLQGWLAEPPVVEPLTVMGSYNLF